MGSSGPLLFLYQQLASNSYRLDILLLDVEREHLLSILHTSKWCLCRVLEAGGTKEANVSLGYLDHSGSTRTREPKMLPKPPSIDHGCTLSAFGLCMKLSSLFIFITSANNCPITITISYKFPSSSSHWTRNNVGTFSRSFQPDSFWRACSSCVCNGLKHHHLHSGKLCSRLTINIRMALGISILQLIKGRC